jgi:hypothetical protein
MGVHMCVFCMYLCECACLRTCLPACVVFKQLCVYVCVCVCLFVFDSLCWYICCGLTVCVCVCVCVWCLSASVCVFVCIQNNLCDMCTHMAASATAEPGHRTCATGAPCHPCAFKSARRRRISSRILVYRQVRVHMAHMVFGSSLQ